MASREYASSHLMHAFIQMSTHPKTLQFKLIFMLLSQQYCCSEPSCRLTPDQYLCPAHEFFIWSNTPFTPADEIWMISFHLLVKANKCSIESTMMLYVTDSLYSAGSG